MRRTSGELFAEVAAAGEDLETVVRGLLAKLAELTGLSSTYLAETQLNEDEQRILFSYNSSQLFHVPEGVTLPWSEAVCRFVVEGGPNYSKNVPKAFPKSSVARLLDIRTFVSYPVFTSDGKFFGTLCGASRGEVEIEREILDLMRECAYLLGQRVRPGPTIDKRRGS